MKTTVDIPDKVLAEAMRHTRATTKQEAVVTAIEDFNRRRRVAELIRLRRFQHAVVERGTRGTRRETGPQARRDARPVKLVDTSSRVHQIRKRDRLARL
jgi:hypothetical protein